MGIIDQNHQNAEKLAAAKAAVKLVKNGDVVGLGTGTTATFAIRELGLLVSQGLSIKAVASSIRTEELAKSLGIEILNLGETASVDISIDGADEFTEGLELIKGGGGALFREKIVASLSKKAIIVTDSSKKVKKLGAFTVPIEVIPLAYQHVFDQLSKLNGKGHKRITAEGDYLTDNGNVIIDADFGLIENPKALSNALNQIDGLLAHGLFIDLTAQVIMSDRSEIITFK